MSNEMQQIDDTISYMDDMLDNSFAEHERIVRLARLAMLIECEGCISIGMAPPTITRPRPSLYPLVSVTNTAEAIIKEAIDTLISEGISFTARPRRPSAGLGVKMRHDLNLHCRGRVGAVLNVILPYLRSKRKQAEIVLEFIDSRRKADQKSAYSSHEWQLTTEVRLLNGKQPDRKALAKAKAYLESPNDANRARTAEYFRKYVEMCTTLQDAL